MRRTVAKRLRKEARKKAMDGSVISSHEYHRLKKSYNNPSYAPVVVLFPTKPGIKFTAKYRLQQKNKSHE